jgi:hypothetical protein
MDAGLRRHETNPRRLNVKIKWTKNYGGAPLPGLLDERPVRACDWSGYDVGGQLVATINRDHGLCCWHVLVRMADGSIQQAGYGRCTRLDDARSRARNWPRD